jgi:16S rRNA processing protein RimM
VPPAEQPTLPDVLAPVVVVVGRIGAPYGIKGWLNVISYTDPLDNIVHYTPWFVERGGNWSEANVIRTKPHRNGFVAQFAGIDDRDAAQRLVGQSIGVLETALPPAGEDEFYWKDLIGLDVVNPSGTVVGQISALMETGANDVIVVRTEGGEVLIPFVRHVVIDVDLQNRRIVVDWQSDG